jgi:hypothetical protein
MIFTVFGVGEFGGTNQNRGSTGARVARNLAPFSSSPNLNGGIPLLIICAQAGSLAIA